MSLQSKMLTLLSFGMIVLTAGCGQATDTVRLKILTNMDTPVAAVDLMKATLGMANPNLMSNPTIGNPLRCEQRNVYAGFMKSGDAAQSFEVYPVQMNTPRDLSAGASDMASWLATNAVVSSVNIPVTHGAKVDFGVFGNIVTSATPSDSADCLQIDPLTQTAISSYTLAGKHDGVTISSATEINLGVWILPFNSAPNSVTNCAGASDACANKDFIKAQCTGDCSPYASGYVRFEYFAGGNRVDHPTQIIPMSTLYGGGIASLPSLDHMVATLYTVTFQVSAPVGSVTIDKSKWINHTAQYTFPGTNAALTLSEY